jgi:Domain of unknown function (DUF4402)
MTNASALRLALFGFAALGSLAAHQAAQAANASATSRAQVRQPVTLSNSRDLNFGNIIRGATTGTVTINARTGARTNAGGTVLQGTGFTSAAFTGTGTGGRVVTLSIGAPSITLAGPGGATMLVNTFRISIGGGAQQTLPRNATLPALGSQSFGIGGRLNVAANQADGDYTGSFSLTMNYQ